MDIFLNNFSFILINSFLALVAVLFGWLMSKANSAFAKVWTGFIWFIFLPNTIYILTDISHLFEQLPKVSGLFKFILILQYLFFLAFGIISFVISVHFFHRLLQGKSAGWKIENLKPSNFVAICVLNFLAGFAVILGGIQRTNSWNILTNPSRVLEDTLNLIYAPQLLILSLGVGILANAAYFTLAETVATWGKNLFKK